jgi:hypothetical protein
MFHLNKMSLKEVINTNLALNPLLTRGEKANSVIPEYLGTIAAAADANTASITLTDGQATSSAFQFRLADDGMVNERIYNIAYPTTNNLAYNPRLYPVLNVIAGSTDANLSANGGSGAITARILYTGNYGQTNSGPQITGGTFLQIRRTISLGQMTKTLAIVEVRFVEMPINDVGLNADLATGGNQIRDTVIVA